MTFLNKKLSYLLKHHQKKLTFLIILLLNLFTLNSQNINNYLQEYNKSKSDSAKVFLLITISDEYRQINPDSSAYFAREAFKIANTRNNNKLIAYSKIAMANTFSFNLDIEKSLKYSNEALSFFYSINDDYGKMKAFAAIGIAYREITQKLSIISFMLLKLLKKKKLFDRKFLFI